MEEKLPKFNREIRRKREDSMVRSISNWDDGDSSLITVEIKYTSFKEILAHYGIDLRAAKVLEVGSGNAKFLDYIRKQGTDAVGVDIRPRGRKESPQVIARIEQLPFGDGSFNAIYSEAAFDPDVYNQEHNLMMQEIYRVLRHGGIYYALQENIQAKHIEGFDLVPLSNSGLQIYKKS